MMELESCIRSRMSSRSFEKRSISKEVLIEILDSARYAPSPKNRQPWRFLVLLDDEKNYIVENYRKEKNCSYKSGYLMNGETNSENDSFEIINRAPVLILVFNAFPSQKVLSSNNTDFDSMNTLAIGAAVEHILLRAADLGVSSLWLGDILSEEDLISALYPDIGKLVSGIALGYSDAQCKRTDRLAFPEVIFGCGEDSSWMD